MRGAINFTWACHPGSRAAAIRDPLYRLQDGSRLGAMLMHRLAGMTGEVLGKQHAARLTRQSNAASPRAGVARRDARKHTALARCPAPACLGAMESRWRFGSAPNGCATACR